jgi:P27 family predicted phage terminase small subunit
MPEYAQQEWQRVASPLWTCGLLTEADHAVLGAYCCAYAHWRTAEEKLAAVAARDKISAGLLVRTAEGACVNPLVRVARAAADQMINFASHLGATPVARARISVGPGDSGDGKFEGLLK